MNLLCFIQTPERPAHYWGSLDPIALGAVALLTGYGPPPFLSLW